MSMKDRLAAKSAAAIPNPRPAPEPHQGARTAPGKMLQAMPFLAEIENERDQLKEQLISIEKNATSRKIKLSELHEVPGRRRKLSAIEYEELKANLKNHPLVTPITVRERELGAYEIISGHNRVAIYRELGHKEIWAVEQILNDTDTELGALFANLFHPTLPDIQKYAAFKRLQVLTNKNQKELALESGVDIHSINRWLSFDKLPEESLQLIKENPDKIGGAAAKQFASIARDKKRESDVISAVAFVIEGKLTQAEAVSFAKAGKSLKNGKIENIKIKAGKKIYCVIRPIKQTLRLDFETEKERAEVELIIRDILQKRAAKSK